MAKRPPAPLCNGLPFSETLNLLNVKLLVCMVKITLRKLLGFTIYDL